MPTEHQTGSGPPTPEPGTPTSDKRRSWETQWQQRAGADFQWYLSEPPPELVELMAREDLPGGGALDLGCGPGVATASLASRFSPAVGMDIASGAVSEARALAREKGERASFLVAEAPLLPFRDRSFGLVFDRGCLQAIPRNAWERYFREVERLLVPGGMLQLYVSKAAREFPPLLSARGVRLRLKWLKGKRGPQFVSPDLIRGLLPGSMRELELRQFPFRVAGGKLRNVTYGLFRKD